MNQEALRVMNERFGKDTVIALGTTDGAYPAIRYVNAYYEDGTFYVITYALSHKMQQIEKNPNVSVCAEWFTARGKGENGGFLAFYPDSWLLCDSFPVPLVSAKCHTEGH